MKKIFIAFLFVFPIFPNEIDDAKMLLKNMQTQMEFIRLQGLHIQDEGRILILDKATQNILRSVDENGLLSAITMNLYKHMVVKFRYSTQYFEFIRTQQTEKAIIELLNIVAAIRKKLQLDEDPYSTVLKSNLTQILETFDLLRKQPELTEETRKKLEELRPALGEAIAIAELGDRPKAFEAATQIYWKIKAIYPHLQGVTSKAGYALSLEIMGLNEFIAEYAQIEK